MSFSYDLTTDVGRVRLLISDTATTTAKFTDEEIQYFLDEEDDVINLAAAMAFEALAGRAADTGKSETIGDYSCDSSSQAKNWLAMAKALRDKEESALYCYSTRI